MLKKCQEVSYKQGQDAHFYNTSLKEQKSKTYAIHSLYWILHSTLKRWNEQQGKTARIGCGHFGLHEDRNSEMSYLKLKSLHQTRNKTEFHKEERCLSKKSGMYTPLFM